MTWLRILLAGAFRFADGSSLNYPRFVTTALTAITAGWIAWDASLNLSVSVILGANAAVCIQAGWTKWENLKVQILRGFFGSLPQFWALCLTFLMGWSSAPSLLFCLLAPVLYIIAYAQYFLVDKYETPLLTVEQWCRITQGALICGAAALV